MEFGKLPDISKVDFSLPEDASGTAETLRKYNKSEKFHFYIGCTGWSMKEWVGTYYPAGTKPEGFLRAYGKQFNTIELNTTHYRIPSPEQIQNWKKDTPADFRFCPKIPQILSHSRDLGISNPLFLNFCEVTAQMEEKLGACFLQLPPHFGLQQAGILERFVERWPKELPLNVEMRHESWFEGPADEREKAFGMLAKAGIGTVLTDVAGRRAGEALHGVAVLVLRHVEAEERPLVAEQLFGEGLGELGLADPGGAHEEHRAARSPGLHQPGDLPARAVAERGEQLVETAHEWRE